MTDSPSGTPDADALPDAPLDARPPLWKRVAGSRVGLAGLAVIALLYFGAIFADFLAPHDPNAQYLERVHAPPQWPRIHDGAGYRAPFVYGVERVLDDDGIGRRYEVDRSETFPLQLLVASEPYHLWGVIPLEVRFVGVAGSPWTPFGADRLGRDVLSRILHGGRVSLTIGLVGVAITVVLGTLIGVASGYFGGWVDVCIQRVIEVLMSFPAIPLWMALAAALPADWSPVAVYAGIVAILSLVGWGGLARQVRGLALVYRESGYVRAARLAGASHGYVIRRHLVPACRGYLIVAATLAIPATILGETALSFLGLGVRPPMVSWGVLLEEAQHVRVIVESPWLLFPAVPVLLTVVGFNFLGDALRDAEAQA